MSDDKNYKEDCKSIVKIKNSFKDREYLQSLVAGVGAGIICTITCAPLDLIKVRLQVQGSLGIHKYTGGIHSVLSKIYAEEGISGVFRGVGPALITIPLFWGVYWPIYDSFKIYYNRKLDNKSEPINHILSAITAGAISDLITNPFWVTRTRIQTLSLHKERHLSSNINSLQMMKTIYQQEGIRAFYRGLSASFLGLSHVAIQFPLYESLKCLARDRREKKEDTFFGLLLSSIAAKLVASTLTYPHEVLRARLQDLGRPKLVASTSSIGLYSLLKDIIAKEGLWALWSGLHINLIRVLPATSTTFLSYEYISKYLKNTLANP